MQTIHTDHSRFAVSRMVGRLAALTTLLLSLVLPARAELLFHATFEGDSTEAVVAKGGGTPLDAKHIEWTDGVRGRGVRLTVAKGSLLSYAQTGNVVQERGTVSLWAKC